VSPVLRDKHLSFKHSLWPVTAFSLTGLWQATGKKLAAESLKPHLYASF